MEAKDNFADVDDKAEKQSPSFWETYEMFRREFDLEELDINPGEIFGEVRDPSPGRDFHW